MIDTRNDMIRMMADFYLKNQKSVHITMKSGQWYNAVIISVAKNHMIIMEEVYGEMMVLFERIKDDGIMPKGEKK